MVLVRELACLLRRDLFDRIEGVEFKLGMDAN